MLEAAVTLWSPRLSATTQPAELVASPQSVTFMGQQQQLQGEQV